MKDKTDYNNSIKKVSIFNKSKREKIEKIEVIDLFVPTSRIGIFEINKDFDLLKFSKQYKSFFIPWNETHRLSLLKKDIEKYRINDIEKQDFIKRFNSNYYNFYWKPIEVRRWAGKKIGASINNIIWNSGLGIFRYRNTPFITSYHNNINVFEKATQEYKDLLLNKLK